MYLEIVLIGIALAMDAFAMSILDGMVYSDIDKKKAVSIPIIFAVFQAVMPLIGFYLGTLFLQYIESFDHWIALALLLFIGGKMIYEAIKELSSKDDKAIEPKKYSLTEVIIQGVATSIDALAVGVTLIMMNANVWASISIIGGVTLLITAVGVYIGISFGKLFAKKASYAEIIGGVVLILIGIKIVLEHTLGL